MLKACHDETLTEAGCDEAGRGCLAGPVVAAAVILPKNFSHPVLNDSKKLSHRQRNELKSEIIASAISWAVASADNEEIDRINILNASFVAMHRAIGQLKIKPGLLLIDGNRFHAYENIPHACIVKGDGKYFSIAAASVLAKTFRDEIMEHAHHDYPVYNWLKNKGYPTRTHRDAILEYGASPLHRKSFTLVPPQLKLF